jgi:hypothetical protein
VANIAILFVYNYTVLKLPVNSKIQISLHSKLLLSPTTRLPYSIFYLVQLLVMSDQSNKKQPRIAPSPRKCTEIGKVLTPAPVGVGVTAVPVADGSEPYDTLASSLIAPTVISTYTVRARSIRVRRLDKMERSSTEERLVTIRLQTRMEWLSAKASVLRVESRRLELWRDRCLARL